MAGNSLHGMFMLPDVRSAPVSRIIGNLERQLAKDTDQPATLYYLGRLYAMSAVQIAELKVNKKDESPNLFLDDGIPDRVQEKRTSNRPDSDKQWIKSLSYFSRAVELLPRSTNRDDHWLILPANLGYGWALLQSGNTNRAKEQLRKTLKIAWAKEVGTKTHELVDSIRWSIQARERLGWQGKHLGPGNVFSDEVIGYLLPRLDPRRDADEIESLNHKKKKLASMGRVITPIVVPLASDLPLDHLVHPESAVSFDLDGSGFKRPWGWIDPKAAWLVWDPRDERHITSGLQLFGSVTWWIFWRDGYEALSVLDDNDDGVLDGPELDGLALWNDRNGNGISEPNEVTPARKAGLTAVRFHAQVHPSGIPFVPNGASFGTETRPTFDWISPSQGTPVR